MYIGYDHIYTNKILYLMFCCNIGISTWKSKFVSTYCSLTGKLGTVNIRWRIIEE